MLDEILSQSGIFLLVAVRSLGLLFTLPLFSMRTVPRSSRFVLAGYMAFIMMGYADYASYQSFTSITNTDSSFSLYFLLLLIGEGMIGVVMGFYVSIIFAAFSTAGQFFAFQMGFSAASAYDALSQVENPLIGQFLNLCSMLIFMQSEWFQKLFIQGLSRSLSSLNCIELVYGREKLVTFLLKGLTNLFADAMLIALPIMGTLLLVTICMGLLGKAAPQMNLLSEGFPIMILLAFGIFVLFFKDLCDFFIHSFNTGINDLQSIFHAIGNVSMADKVPALENASQAVENQASLIDLQWFAAEDEGRTEEPSETKIRKAREEGRVPKSQDVNSSLVFFACVITLIFLAKSILSECALVMRYFFTRCNDTAVLTMSSVVFFARSLAKIVLPIAAIGVVAAMAANIVQNKGFIFTLKPIQPDFKKIVPNFGEYFKKTLFSGKGLFNVVKSLGKVFIIVFVAYLLIRRNLPLIIYTIKTSSIISAISVVAKVASQLMVIVAVLFIAVGIPDFFVQKKSFIEEMKMTKYEVKQEYKEMEGDPEIKGRLKQEQQRILSQNVREAVRTSDVVITNPTHFAISLKYEATQADAPMVTAKGEDERALFIKQVARENDIPTIENRPLARGLYTDTEVGDIIPQDYWNLIAQIYAKIGNYDSIKS